jgi:hydroxymethylglutaryl-CoA reductase (NADPH)
MTLAPSSGRTPVPRDPADDYTRDAAQLRQDFLTEQTGASLEHVSSYSVEPATRPGNIEHFTGVAASSTRASTTRPATRRART